VPERRRRHHHAGALHLRRRAQHRPAARQPAALLTSLPRLPGVLGRQVQAEDRQGRDAGVVRAERGQHRRRLVDPARRQAQPLQPRARALLQPGASWQPDYAVYEDLTHRTQDANQVLEQTLDLPFTRNLYTARRSARSRRSGAATARWSRSPRRSPPPASRWATWCRSRTPRPAGRPRRPGEGKLFRVVEIELLSSDEVRLTLLEYNAPSTPRHAGAGPRGRRPRRCRICPRWRRPARRRVPSRSTRPPARPAQEPATVTWATANDVFVQRGGWYQLERAPAGIGELDDLPADPGPGTASHGELRVRRHRARHLRLARGKAFNTDRREERLFADHHQGDRRPHRAAVQRRQLRRAELRRPGEVHLGQALVERRPRRADRRPHLRALVAEDLRRDLGPRLARQPGRLPGRHVDRLRPADDGHVHGEVHGLERQLLATEASFVVTEALITGSRRSPR
jgi:hypothetical protein